MKNKYGIGFLLFLILVVFGITCAYQLSLNKGKREIQAEINAKEQKEMNNTSVAADGQALKDDCYYLKELNGYVVVYLSDKKTVYEYTAVETDSQRYHGGVIKRQYMNIQIFHWRAFRKIFKKKFRMENI